jgi:hypothetical protein
MKQISSKLILSSLILNLFICQAVHAAIMPDPVIKNDLISIFKTPVEVKGYPYQDLLADASKKYNLPLPYLLAVVRGESFFTPNAKSSKGAIGLMQVMPSTASIYGISKKELYEPKKNVDAGVHYLADLYKQLKDPYLTLAAYYCGPGGVDKKTFTLRKDCNEYVQYIHRHLKKIMAKAKPREKVTDSQMFGEPVDTIKHFELTSFDNFLDANQFLNFISKKLPGIEFDIFRKETLSAEHELFQYQILSRADGSLTRKNICNIVAEKSGFLFCDQ